MSTETQATAVKTTGIPDADAFMARAKELGLNAKFEVTNSEAVYDGNGSVMLPAVLSVSVTVSIPVPEELSSTHLGMVERCNTLTGMWTKRLTPRSRGRWTSANHSTLGGHEDLHVKHRMYTRLDGMADDLKRLLKLVQD